MKLNRLRAYGLLLGCFALPACSASPDGEPVPSPSAEAPDAAAAPAATLPVANHAGVARVVVPAAPGDEGSGAAPAAPAPAASFNDVGYNGGSVISSVHVVPVFWGTNVNATVQREIHCYYSAAVRSPYMDWLSEYNTPTQTIGRGSVGNDVTITPGHTGTVLSDADIQGEIGSQIDLHLLPAPDANTLYMIYFPPGVSMTGNGGSCAAGGFCAYHNSFAHSSKRVRYGVFPDYATGSPCAAICGGGTMFQNVGYASAHELTEAVTDPDPGSGWTGVNGEIGDTCNQQEVTLPGTSFTVQNLWSNSRGACYAGAAGSAITEPLVVDSITPTVGPADRSFSFTVNGSCLASPRVSIVKGNATTLGTLTASSSSQLTVTIPGSPDHLVGAGQLSITNSDGAGFASSTFTFLPSNTITLSPTTGPMQGGVPITITGGPFRVGANTIHATFGGVTNTSAAQCDSTTSCVVYPPPHDPGTVNVTLSVDGTTEAVSNTFTYLGPQIDRVTPVSGPISGGTDVSVRGLNMTDTSVDSFQATGTLGGVQLGSIWCSRQGSHDASCSFKVPARASVPAGPLDIQLTVTHTTGRHVTTPIAAVDRFTYTALPAVTSLGFLASASGGQTESASLYLSGNAPPGGALVSLALAPGAPAGVVQFPSTVVVPAGQSSAAVPVLVVNQDYTGDVAILASYAGTIVTGTLRVYPTPHPTLGPILPLCAAHAFAETITLAEPAPPGGGVVHLSVDNGAASVPATLTIPAGSTTASFAVTAASPATAQAVHLSADYYGITAVPVAFNVLPAAGVSLSLTSSVQGGGSASGTVALCGAAPAGGAVVAVSSDNASAIPPATVTIPAGSTSTSLDVATRRVSAAQHASITASYQGNTATAGLGISAPPVAPTCPVGQTLCTCMGGQHTCASSSTLCLRFCQGK